MGGCPVGGRAARKAHAEASGATERAPGGEAGHAAAPGRGKELPDACRGLQEALGAPACFCHPRHPWERGTSENANGLLRDWLPKGESLDDASEVQEACGSPSRRPRKRLRWKCPWEVYRRRSLHLL